MLSLQKLLSFQTTKVKPDIIWIHVVHVPISVLIFFVNIHVPIAFGLICSRVTISFGFLFLLLIPRRSFDFSREIFNLHEQRCTLGRIYIF